QTALAREALRPLAPAAVAHEEQARVGPPRVHAREGVEEMVVPLGATEHGDRAQDGAGRGAAGREAEGTERRLAPVPAREVVEIDAGGYRYHPLGSDAGGDHELAD